MSIGILLQKLGKNFKEMFVLKKITIKEFFDLFPKDNIDNQVYVCIYKNMEDFAPIYITKINQIPQKFHQKNIMKINVFYDGIINIYLK